MAETVTRDERHLELVARVRKAIKAAWYPGIDWDSDVLAYAALTAAEQVRASEPDKLREAVNKFLEGRMAQFPDSRFVDDDLVELAAAYSGITD